MQCIRAMFNINSIYNKKAIIPSCIRVIIDSVVLQYSLHIFCLESFICYSGWEVILRFVKQSRHFLRDKMYFILTITGGSRGVVIAWWCGDTLGEWWYLSSSPEIANSLEILLPLSLLFRMYTDCVCHDVLQINIYLNKTLHLML